MVHIGVIPDGNRRWCKKNDIDFFECIKMIKNIMTNILSWDLNKEFNNTNLMRFVFLSTNKSKINSASFVSM